MSTPLYILDGYGLIFRSYFAFSSGHLRDQSGRNTSAIFGFFRTLHQLLSTSKTDNLVVALDSKGPTFRDEIYPEYKANRDATPEDLVEQIPVILDALTDAGFPFLAASGFEADDIIATLAAMRSSSGEDTVIVSADKDLMQLVDDHCTMLRPSRNGLQWWKPADVLANKGVRPDQMGDYLALLGDTSDNIPGVKGIGEKTAAKLLGQYQSLEGIYQLLDEIKPPGVQKKLREGREMADLSRRLVALRYDVTLGKVDTTMGTEVYTKLAEQMEKLEIPSLAKDFLSLCQTDSSEGHSYPSEPVVKTSYRMVSDFESLEEELERLDGAECFALDTETTGVDPMAADLVGISWSIAEGHGVYLPILGPNGPLWSDEERLHRLLKSSFEGARGRIIGQNIKYDLHILSNWGIDLPQPGGDTMIAAWLLQSDENSLSMDALAQKYLSYNCISYSQVTADLPKGATFDQVDLEKATSYAAEDADITLRLHGALEPLLRERGLEEVYTQLELPLIPVLCSMEAKGVHLNAEAMAQYSEVLGTTIERIEQDVHQLCGEVFNLASTKQLQRILFEVRGLEPVKKTKTGYSTDTTVLEILATQDPVPRMILKHRQLSKLKNTYVDTLPQLINPKTQRIHTTYVQTGTATGRMSSKDPNLQNIPIKDEEGRKIREAFVPAPGYRFVSADYSQIELVVLAHLSGDENLTRAFNQGRDVHRETAALLFGIDPDSVQPDQRRVAKTINFGVMYGMSAFRLSRDLGISRADADMFLKTYFETYKGVHGLSAQVVAEAESHGGVRTMGGRFRPIPHIASSNKMERQGAERIALNTPIQGSAADIVKKAMVSLHHRLIEENLDAHLVLQVHDELIIEAAQDQVDRVSVIMEEVMSAAMDLTVPLRVNIELGESWGDMH